MSTASALTMLRAAETICKTDTGRQRRGQRGQRVRARAGVRRRRRHGRRAGRRGRLADRGRGVRAGAARIPAAPRSGWPTRVREANRRIYERSHAERERAGMGTTLTAAYVDDTARSRSPTSATAAPTCSATASSTRLTQDHSLVEELVRRGKLTEEQAAEHPQRSIITRALGPEPTSRSTRGPIRCGPATSCCCAATG